MNAYLTPIDRRLTARHSGPGAASLARLSRLPLRRIYALTLLAMLLLSVAIDSIAGEIFPVSEMGPPGDTAYSARRPVLAYHRQLDQFLAAWDGINDDQAHHEREIFVRPLHRRDARALAGQTRVTALGGIGSASGQSYNPRLLAVNPCVTQVCWMLLFNGHEAFGDQQIYAQPLAADRLPTGQPRMISRRGGIEVKGFVPELLDDGSGQSFLAFWVQFESGGSGINGHEIYHRNLQASGSTTAPPQRLSHGTGNVKITRPAAARDTSRNEVLVVWLAANSAWPRERLFGRFLDANGIALTAPLQLAECGDVECAGLSLAYDPVNRKYLLLWLQGPLSTEQRPAGVIALSIDPLTGPVGTARQISTPDSYSWTGLNGAPSLTWVPESGRFAAIWKESPNRQFVGHLVAAGIDSNPAAVPDRFAINAAATGSLFEGHLSFDPALGGRVLVGWVSDFPLQEDYEVQARHLAPQDFRSPVVFASGFE